jgi:hypothetical protein
MSAFFVEKQFGPHTGQLLSSGAFVATNVPIARCGWKQYRESELWSGGSSKLVDVYTSPEELFSPLTMASAEGKSVTLSHPARFVDPFNWKGVAVGHMTNVHRGTERLDDGNFPLLADIVVADVQGIDAVKGAGIRGTSLGYDCKYIALDDGTLAQTEIRVNHLALVGTPRTGNTRIEDSMDEYTEQDFQAAMDTLNAITEGLNARQRTTDADATAKNAAALAQDYADRVNQVGARMGRRDCRPSLRHVEDAAAVKLPELTLQQKLDAHIRAEEYSAECRKLWRKSSPSS